MHVTGMEMAAVPGTGVWVAIVLVTLTVPSESWAEFL